EITIQKRHLVIGLILVSVVFNLSVLLLQSTSSRPQSSWYFPELGPAVIQDSFLGRAPSLESPFGMIGDIPGGYSLYSGNPLQKPMNSNVSEWIGGSAPWVLTKPQPSWNVLFSAILLALVPSSIIIMLGRRSFGSAKTH
ncbi:MAG: hypothetical protein ACFE7R_11055, partial [Candidatus Hodarchaeota archaeon]